MQKRDIGSAFNQQMLELEQWSFLLHTFPSFTGMPHQRRGPFPPVLPFPFFSLIAIFLFFPSCVCFWPARQSRIGRGTAQSSNFLFPLSSPTCSPWLGACTSQKYCTLLLVCPWTEKGPVGRHIHQMDRPSRSTSRTRHITRVPE